MPSPDATPYVDLRLYDKDTQDLFAAAVTNLASYLPDWTPREGHTEVLLLESLALEVSEGVFAINRLPGAIMEILLKLYGVDRDLGTPPTADLTFTLSDTTGHTIPAGTRASLPLPAGRPPLVFTTLTELVVAPGGATGTVAAVGDQNTSAGNGTLAGTALELRDAIVFVERVELGGAVTGGVDEEDDQAWFDRGVLRFSRLVETLVLPRHFVAAALGEPNVTRASAIDNYDPGQAGNPGDHAGHVTVAVYGDGAVLSAADREVLRAAFDLQAQANLAVHVVDPTLTAVDVNVTVLAEAGFTATFVQDAVTAALEAFLSPELWPWSQTVYRNELISLIDQVEGVDRVETLTTPAADALLAGIAPLATAGTITVTVNV